MLVEAVIFRGNHGIDQIRRNLVETDLLAILNKNLPVNFPVSIVNDTGRFNFVQLFQIELGCLFFVTKNDSEIKARRDQGKQQDQNAGNNKPDPSVKGLFRFSHRKRQA